MSEHPWIFQILDDKGLIYHPTEIQVEVALLMSAGATALRAARKVKIPKATIRAWEKETWFRKLQRRMAVEVYLESIQQAAHAMPEAIQLLKDIAFSRESSLKDKAAAIATLEKMADRCQGLVFEERNNDIEVAIERDRRIQI